MSFNFSSYLMGYLLTLTILGAALSGCATSGDPNVVSGRLMGPGVTAPTDSAIYTRRAGPGVQITSSAGGGRRPVALSGPEAVRLVNAIESRLDRWREFTDAAPFEETIMIGLAGTSGPQPFTVQLAKSPGMKAPVFLVTIAYADAVASVALDRTNAEKWSRQLQGVLTAN